MNIIMNYFHNLSLRSRLNWAMGGIIGLLMMSIFGIELLVQSTESLLTKKDVLSQQAIFIREYQVHVANIWQFYTDASLTHEPDAISEAEAERDKAKIAIDSFLNLAVDKTEGDKTKKLENLLDEFVSIGIKMERAYTKSDTAGGLVMEEYDKKGSEILANLNPLVEKHIQANLNINNEIGAYFSSFTIYSLISIGIIIIIMFFTSRKITNYISRSLEKLIGLFSKVKIGDFSHRIININDNDEFGYIMWETNEFIDQIEALLKEIITSIKYAGEGKFFRKPLAAGLKGMLKKSCEEVSQSVVQSENLAKKTNDEKNYLAKNVDTILEAMDRFSKGDLTVKVSKERNDEIGNLFDGFNTAVQNIKGVISQVVYNVQQTSNLSNEMSSSSEQMAAGAQEQSSQTAEIAGAIEEMTSTIFESSQNSKRSSDAARQAGEVAKEGSEVLEEAIVEMNLIADVVKDSAAIVNALGKSSDEIGEIIQVINDIADQTNLLALNAAIEAARAGEQGRGFAVVADEVRKLAERTTKATNEIANMIKQIQNDTSGAVSAMEKGTEEVEKGKALANKAGESLKEIRVGVDEVIELSAQVAMASDEEAKAAELISKNIDGINHATQETAIGIQQIARSSEDLNELSENLNLLASNFTIDNSGQSIASNQNLISNN